MALRKQRPSPNGTETCPQSSPSPAGCTIFVGQPLTDLSVPPDLVTLGVTSLGCGLTNSLTAQ